MNPMLTQIMTIGLGLWFILGSGGCTGNQGSPANEDQGYPGLDSNPNAVSTQPVNKGGGTAARVDGGVAPIGYLNGVMIRSDQLQPQLVEAAGGQVLFEYVLDTQLAEELKRKKITLSEEQVKREEKLMLDGLDVDINQAQRVLSELRERRGLGPVRFKQMLYRNAALRALVAVPAELSDLALRQEFEVLYGTRYEIRIITVESPTKAQEVLRRLRGGETFTDLAVQLSTDASRQQGGLLSPFNTQDESYPKAIRDQLEKLKVNQVSDPIALADGFVLIRLERKIEGGKPNFDDVKNQLTQSVNLRIQRVGMDQLVRTLMIKAQLTLTSDTYNRVWELQKKRFGSPER
jgi:foldase protein PrsA